jgi:hypothetical protein
MTARARAESAPADIQDVVLLLRGHLIAVARDGKIVTTNDLLRLLDRAEAADHALRTALYAKDENDDAACDDDDDTDDGDNSFVPPPELTCGLDDHTGDFTEWLRDRIDSKVDPA